MNIPAEFWIGALLIVLIGLIEVQKVWKPSPHDWKAQVGIVVLITALHLQTSAAVMTGVLLGASLFLTVLLLVLVNRSPPGSRLEVLRNVALRRKRAGNGVNAPKPEGARQRGLDTRARDTVPRRDWEGQPSPAPEGRGEKPPDGGLGVNSSESRT